MSVTAISSATAAVPVRIETVAIDAIFAVCTVVAMFNTGVTLKQHHILRV